MHIFAERCPWYVAGPLLGVLIVALRWAANLHLGATGAFVGVTELAERRSSGPSWRATFFVGMLLGGVLSALLAGGAHASFAHGSFDAHLGRSLATKAIVLLGAGAAMGFGARTAGGCTSGHGICGTAQGSPASFVATMTFMATAIFATWLLSLAEGS